jgi:hypothetical protein
MYIPPANLLPCLCCLKILPVLNTYFTGKSLLLDVSNICIMSCHAWLHAPTSCLQELMHGCHHPRLTMVVFSTTQANCDNINATKLDALMQTIKKPQQPNIPECNNENCIYWRSASPRLQAPYMYTNFLLLAVWFIGISLWALGFQFWGLFDIEE